MILFRMHSGRTYGLLARYTTQVLFHICASALLKDELQTEIYRKVFHAVPDDLITTWKQYREFVLHHERLNKPVSIPSFLQNHGGLMSLQARDTSPEPVGRMPSETGDENAPGQDIGESVAAPAPDEGSKEATEPTASDTAVNASLSDKDTKARKPAKGTEPFEKWEREEMEKLLGELNGHLGKLVACVCGATYSNPF